MPRLRDSVADCLIVTIEKRTYFDDVTEGTLVETLVGLSEQFQGSPYYSATCFPVPDQVGQSHDIF